MKQQANIAVNGQQLRRSGGRAASQPVRVLSQGVLPAAAADTEHSAIDDSTGGQNEQHYP